MEVYVYQAALLCEECGDKCRNELTTAGKAPSDPDDETSYDSDAFPKGPYPDGGGESDTPSHCDHCRLFLENPLTDDGAQFVREAVMEDVRRFVSKGVVPDSASWTEWRPYYDITVNVTVGDYVETDEESFPELLEGRS